MNKQCKGFKTDGSRCSRPAKKNQYCWQHQKSKNQQTPIVNQGQTTTSTSQSTNKPVWTVKPVQTPKPIYFKVANFNVLNHLHLNKFTKFSESVDQSIDRYLYAITLLLDYVDQYQISAVGLSEVTDEFHDAFVAYMKNEITAGNVTLFYEGQSLMTVFFDNRNLRLQKISQVDVEYHPHRDRLQIFNLSIQKSGQSKKLTFINIHGYGLPEIREKYLYNTLLYINQLRTSGVIHNQLICCGDFNSDLDQVNVVAQRMFNDTGTTDFHVYQNFFSTSYHRYILTSNGEFEEKPKALWYSKMDQLLYTDPLTVLAFERVPHDFTTSEHPYKWVNGYQEMGQWPSDHTLNIYQFVWS